MKSTLTPCGRLVNCSHFQKTFCFTSIACFVSIISDLFTHLIYRLRRSTEGRPSRPRIHPEDVCGPEPGQRQDHLLALHLRYRHRKHPLRLRGGQGHHPAAQPKRVQPSVRERERPKESKTPAAHIRPKALHTSHAETHTHGNRADTPLLPFGTGSSCSPFLCLFFPLFLSVDPLQLIALSSTLPQTRGLGR